MEFRKLRAEEIDCRIQSVKTNGLVLLLYKDARCDMNILDETVGAENWQRNHEVINGNLFCNVGVRVQRVDGAEWIWKQDVGTESNTEKQKGEASDSFKRACFNLGIGRELYTAPFIWITTADCSIKDGKCYDKFYVHKVGYDEQGKINELEIVNDKTKRVVYKMKNEHIEVDDLSTQFASKTELKTLSDMCEILGVDKKEIMVKAGWKSGQVTVEQHGKALIMLNKIQKEQSK